MKRSVGFILLITLGWIQVHSQIAQQAVKQFNRLKNIGYTSLSSGANIFTGERSIDSTDALIVRVSDGSWAYKTRSSTEEKWYYDHKRVNIDLTKKTYKIINDTLEKGSIYLPTLAYIMDQLEQDLAKGLRVTTLPDSVIAGKKYYHFSITQLDSLRDGKRIYGATSFVLDKKTLLPYSYREDGLGYIDGTDMYVTLLNEYTFLNYQLDRNDLPDLSTSLVPEGFTAERSKQATDLLQKGDTAPDIELLDLKGKLTKLSDYKGRVLLVSFTDNGCGYCAMSVKPVNQLLAKYSNSNFTVINVNPFDSPDAIRSYNNRYNVEYESYKPGKSVLQDYHVDGYPNFYVIDKEGKIVKGFGGFSSDLEQKLADAIDRAL